MVTGDMLMLMLIMFMFMFMFMFIMPFEIEVLFWQHARLYSAYIQHH